MNKWRLLLLSVLGLLQSASTEQNFVDGRNRYRWSDTRLSSHESYPLLGHRQLDISNEQSNPVRNAELTTPALQNFRRTELRWRLPPVQDKYDGMDYVTRFRVHTQNDRHQNRQSTYNFKIASDVGSHRVLRDYRKNIDSNSLFRNNKDKKEDTRFRFNGPYERRNYDDMLSSYKRNSRDPINNIRTRIYNVQNNFINRDGNKHDATMRAVRERVFLERDSKGIYLYEEPEARRQTAKSFDSINNSNNLYKRSSEDITRRTAMNQNSQEKDISRNNLVRKSRSHNYIRTKIPDKAILSDDSCTTNTRKNELEAIKVARDNIRRNNVRRTAISEISIQNGSRVFCPEESNSKILNTRTANIILRRKIENDIAKFGSRNRSTQLRTLDEDVHNRHVRDLSPTLRCNTFSQDIYSRNVFSREDSRRDTLRRSQRLSLRKSNKLQIIREMQKVDTKNTQSDNKNANKMETVRNVRDGCIPNNHLNNREQHSVQKRFVSARKGNRNSCNVRSRNLWTQETRINTNKFEFNSNVQDENVLNNIRRTTVSRTKRFLNLHDKERLTETSKLTDQERSQSVFFREGVTNKIRTIRNTQEKLVNLQGVAIIRKRQNLLIPKLHVSTITEENIDHINQHRSTGERARFMLHINSVARKQSIPTREDNTSENRIKQDKRYRTLLTEEKMSDIIHYNKKIPARPLQRSQSRLSPERKYLISNLPVRTTKYIRVVHQDRSRSLTIEKRVSDEIVHTGDIREERFLHKRSITPLIKENHQIYDIKRNRHRSAISGRQSTNKIRQTQNIQKYQNVERVTFLLSDKQNSVKKLYQIPSNSDLTESGRERITNKIHVNKNIDNTGIPNVRREIISSRKHSNPTVVFLVNRKENTNEFRLNEHRHLPADKRLTNQIMNIRYFREERLQDMQYITSVNREKRVMLSRQRERIISELEKTRYIYNERRQDKQVSSSERQHFTTKLDVRQLEHSDNNRRDKLRRSFTRERNEPNANKHSGYSREERLQNIKDIQKLYANDGLIEKTDRNYNRYRILSREDKLERGIPITRHTKINSFVTRERITSLTRDSIRDKELQINQRHGTNVGDTRSLYRSTIHRTNEYIIRGSITDNRRVSLSIKRQCTSLQCSMSTTSVMNDTRNIYEFKWQFLFYLLQGLYLWNLLTKKPKTNGDSYKNVRFPNWFTADYMKIN